MSTAAIDTPDVAAPARCPDPDCTTPASTRWVSGRRFGFPGRIHVACYNRRAARISRDVDRETPRPAPVRTARHFAASHRPAAGRVPPWCPGADQLDRMGAAAAADFIRDAWGEPWASIALTAEPRPADDARGRGGETEAP
jgi:hypothetical protein